jgi:drug/metabolite transporter (DMT)-like permease
VLGVVTAIFYAGYILSVKHVRRQLQAPQVMFAVTSICAVALGLLAWAQGETLWPATSRGWLVCAGLGLLPQFAGQGLIAHGLANLPASFSSVTLLVQPATATVLAWFLLGEELTLLQGGGGSIMVLGIWLCRKAVPVNLEPASRDR